MCENALDSSSELSSPPSSPEWPHDLNFPSSQNTTSEESRADGDMEPARKRRKIASQPRKTHYLDISARSLQGEEEQDAALALMLKVLRKRRKIVVIAGAGISVSAGSKLTKSSSL